MDKDDRLQIALNCMKAADEAEYHNTAMKFLIGAEVNILMDIALSLRKLAEEEEEANLWRKVQ